MTTVSIRTSQNVVVEYEAATIMERVLAQIIDSIIMAFTGFMLSLGLTMFEGVDSEIAYLIGVSIVMIFYTMLFELYNNGQSLAKKMLGIQVIRLDGQELKLNDVLSRWAFSFLDIYMTLGTLALFMVQLSNNRQRIGDLVATTTVIKLRASYHVSLENVLSRKSSEEYVPVYPGVTRLKEDQMVLLKSTIERYEKYKNEAHVDAVVLLAERVAEKLDMAVPKKNKLEFLKQVLKDYVILTR
ncbi:MAG: RDD family protein [Cytophagaceae bacterium]